MLLAHTGGEWAPLVRNDVGPITEGVMATIAPGTAVVLSATAMSSLLYPPPTPEVFVIAHAAALRAPGNPHTQVAAFARTGLVWIGALGEELLSVSPGTPERSRARRECAAGLLQGNRLWDIIKPGSLLVSGAPRPMSTVYDGSERRPWVVIGGTTAGDLIAAPLNDAQSNPKWWTPVISRGDMSFPGNNKDGQVELAHLWTLPSTTLTEGTVYTTGWHGVERAIKDYFDL